MFLKHITHRFDAVSVNRPTRLDYCVRSAILSEEYLPALIRCISLIYPRGGNLQPLRYILMRHHFVKLYSIYRLTV